MSIASRIEAIEQHLTDDYSVLTLAGADLTNVDKNILNLKPTWKERLLYFMNNGTDEVWDNWDKVTGEGTTLTLNNTEEAPMSLVYKGNTLQNGTPTPDSPVPIQVVSGDNSIEVCGKNLARETFDTKFVLAGSGNNRTVVSTNYNSAEIVAVKPNTNYVISGDFSSLADNFIRIGMFDNFPKVDDTSTKYIYGASGLTFTTDTNTKYIMLMNGRIDNTTVDNLQLELGQTPTTYEAYKGASYPITLPEGMFLGWIPNTNYYDKIDKSSGKNLFDKDNDLHYSTDASGNTTTTAYFNSTDYISCNSGDSFTISGIPTTTSDYNFKVVFFDSSKNYISRTIAQAGTTNVRNNFSTTAPTNAKYVMAQFYNTIKEGQFEKGSTATEYEPYGTGWYLRKAIGKVVLDGSENWVKHGSIASWFYYDGITNGYVLDNTQVLIKTNYYTPKAYQGVPNLVNGECSYGSSDGGITHRFVIKNTDYTQTQDFKTWLSTHNTMLYYVLSTPTYTLIEDSTLINQLETIKKSYEGQTNISQTNNDMPFIINATALKEMD